MRVMTVIVAFLTAVLVAIGVCAAPPEQVMLPMSDGTKLATDIHLPGQHGAWPVLLMRSTYGRTGGGVEGFVERGYAVVVQDVRGMGDSEGEEHVFYASGWRPDQHDGADTVAWIHAQDWCNGKVGTMGGSALGITQMLLAPATDLLDAQFIQVAPASFYHEGIYHGGVWRKNLGEGWLAMIQQPHVIDIWKSHPYYDPYWEYMNATAKAPETTAPAVFVGGWYDIFQQGTIDAFTAREERGGTGAKGNNYLVMKWSAHGPDITEDYTFDENRFDLRVSRMREAFFEARLKGDPSALEEYAKVNYYVLGADTAGAPGNEWRTADTWPPYATTATAYYLHADGTLAKEEPAEAGAARTFTYDPGDPYPTHGGANLILPAGPFDQRKYSTTRNDLLKFATAPLEAPLEFTGRVKVRLYVSTDAPDTDFTAKLVDLYPEPDGREILLLDNIQRVKLRKRLSEPEPLLGGPEEVAALDIDLWSMAFIFEKGHRIGLHISSSNHPRFEANPNTGDDHPNGEARPARNTVHLDATHPSALVLPVRPGA